MKSLIYLLCVVMLVFSACKGKPEDPRLLEIAEKVSDSPKEMLERLDSIDVSSMKESDRYFHALLSIKAKDKAYIQHTSDSVILKVIDYYSGHKGSGLYPEALYYGGRVYSDIGDAPTALRYFQDALEEIPENTYKELRATILTQMGWLFNSLRLYNEAARCLNKSVDLQKTLNDSVRLMRDIQLLGAIYLHAEDYDGAEIFLKKARSIAKEVSHKDTLIQDMYLAGTYLYKGDTDKALKGIREVTCSMQDDKREIIFAYASQIYQEAGIPDSTYYFALKLIGCKNNDYRKIGYGLLLSPELREYSQPDSLLSYSLAYKSVLDEYLIRHDAEQVMIQTSLYNYQTHEKNRKKAEAAKRIYMYVAGLVLVFVLILFVGLLYIRNRKMKLCLDYHKTLENIDRLETLLSSTEAELTKYRKVVEEMEAKKNTWQSEPTDETQNPKTGNNPSVKNEPEEDQVCLQLKERLLRLQKAGEAKKNDPKNILGASVYDRLQYNIVNKIGLKADDEIWLEIENDILKLSPEFKTKLTLLVGGKIKVDVYHMALLVRCGFGPTDTGALLGRTKGAVSARRGYICEKIFGEKYGGKVMDDIINLL